MHFLLHIICWSNHLLFTESTFRFGQFQSSVILGRGCDVRILWANCGLLFLATEWIGVSRRSWGACVSQLFGAVGQCILAGMIYFVRDWRLAQFITAAPLAVVAIYIWCALSPSNTLSWVTGIGADRLWRWVTNVSVTCFGQVCSGVSQMVVGQRKDRRG